MKQNKKQNHASGSKPAPHTPKSAQTPALSRDEVLSIAAEAAGRADLMPLWAGQSANLSTCTEVSVFLNSLVEEVSEIAGPLTEWSAKRREKK